MKQIKYITSEHDDDLYQIMNHFEVYESDRTAPPVLGAVGVAVTRVELANVRSGLKLPFVDESKKREIKFAVPSTRTTVS